MCVCVCVCACANATAKTSAVLPTDISSDNPKVGHCFRTEVQSGLT